MNGKCSDMKCMNECMNEMKEWIVNEINEIKWNAWMNEGMNEWNNEINEWMKTWNEMNELKKWMN